ncbi:MAG: helix-turn-helix transcriptional regulator [Proteobacteria bacterium]|nr:helix-turn-helix transcriptional regulator [Pseudomonadota bacterium]
MPRNPGIKSNPSKARVKPAAAAAGQQPSSKRRKILKDGPHPIDVHVGRRMREKRTLLGLSQSHLAEKVGLTFQQIQKYERGTNRISASRLWQLSEILGVPIAWFFEDIGGGAPVNDSVAAKTETLKLARYFIACPPATRKHLAALIKAAAEVC